ncbi:signal peptidase II [Roseburia hominis]
MITLSLLIVSVIFGMDQGMKYYVEKHVKDGKDQGFFRQRGILRKVHNRGMMMNYLEQHPLLVQLASVFAMGILLIWQALTLKKRGHIWEKLGIAFMTGGALSNTFDRVKRGYVVDFLAVKAKQKKLTDMTFNVGDFAIFGGAILTAAGVVRSCLGEGEERE